MKEILCGIALLIFVVSTLAFNPPRTSVRDESPVPLKNAFAMFRGSGEADSVLAVHDASGSVVARYSLLDGDVFQKPEQAASGEFSAVHTRRQFFIDPGIDLGAWTGYRTEADDEDSRVQVGIRYSPVRLAFGTLAPDLVLSQETMGVGASLYLPRSLGRTWHGIGLGAWYCAPYDGGDPGPVFGLSFSTHY